MLENIFLKLLEKNLDKPWDWSGISSNPNITMEFIEKHSDKPWNWGFISHNLTMKFIEKHPNKPWDWEYISSNDFNWKKRQLEDKAARIIQTYFERWKAWYCVAFSHAE